MDIEIIKDSSGVEYATCAFLVISDYGGSGSVGHANIRYLKEHFENNFIEISAGRICCESFSSPMIIESGGHGYERILLRVSDASSEIFKNLESYPVLDDGLLSMIESEWEVEAWSDYVMDDLLRGFVAEIDSDKISKEDILEVVDVAELIDLYRDSMDKTNTYPEPEYNGVSIDVDRISSTFNAMLRGIVMPHLEKKILSSTSVSKAKEDEPSSLGM